MAYSAIHSDSMFLACVGSRTILDRLITRKVGDNGTFRAGLEALEKQGFIAKIDVAIIEAALEAGNASTHRAWVADRSQMETVMNIIENLIERVFLLTDSAKRLKKKIPKRKR